MKKGINEKLERFIDHADTKFDLAGEMFDRLQKQIKELEATLFKAVRRNTELINELDDKTKELEQKANRTGQFHLDAINEQFADINKAVNSDIGVLDEKINKLDNKISALNAKNQKRADAIKTLDDKIDKLEHNYKKLEGNIGAVTTAHNMGVELAKEDSAYNHNKIAQLDNRIDELEGSIKNTDILFGDATRKIFVNIDSIHERIDDCEQDINNVELNIPDINQPTDQTKALKEDYDILEGKYHQLRSELDCVYKVLEMDALDIQDLYEQLENHPKKGENNAK